METNPFRDGAAYVGGQYVPIAQATISVTDWGFTRSDAVYDVVHAFHGGFFRLNEHLDRFMNSMAARRLTIPENRAAIEDALHQVVALSGLREAYVAMVVLRGRPRIAGSRRPQDCDNHLITYAIPWVDVIPQDIQARGAHLWISNHPRVPDSSVDPVVKNYQWSDLTSGLFEAHDNGFDTAVLCDSDGYVTEGPGFNVFIVKDGSVFTPDRGVLRGITRATVLELCENLQIKASVVPMQRTMLESADEVFLTTTAGGLMNVSNLAGRVLNSGVSPVFATLKRNYWEEHERGRYVTPVRYAER
jgi:branched-chain amino acid aminotransferase